MTSYPFHNINLILKKCLYSCQEIKSKVILWSTLSIWFHN